MFGTQQPQSDPEVAALKESVRHNEKSIDRIEAELKDFRTETKAEFTVIRSEINQLKVSIDKVSSNIWKQIVGSAIAIILANVILKYWPQ